ncbi:MAG: hypothetical protein K5770_16015 [Lachnospiraceae bacterium]|nr:hypothetical protein [Lachnospiraceae bacterium]
MGKIWDFDSFGGTPAIIDDKGTEISYAELMDACAKVSGPELDRALVMMFCKNTAGAVSSYVSFWITVSRS